MAILSVLSIYNLKKNWKWNNFICWQIDMREIFVGFKIIMKVSG